MVIFHKPSVFTDVGIIGGCTNESPHSPSSETMYTVGFVGHVRNRVPSLLVTRAEVENALARSGVSDTDGRLGRTVEKNFSGTLERGIVRCNNGGTGSDRLWTVGVD